MFLDRPPLLFRLLKAMERRRIRGAGRLARAIDRLRLFEGKIVRFDLERGYSIHVPIYRPERWDLADLVQYEHALVSSLLEAARSCDGKLTLVDCGADIGLISVTAAAALKDRLERIVALEPSAEAFTVLERTLKGLPVAATVLQMGVSDFTGQGELRTPEYDASHHARYLARVAGGGFPVTTIDALGISALNLLLKIDVEGGEVEVIRGAQRTLAGARRAIVALEAHPKVYGRTGVDPSVALRELQSIRPFRFVVAETGYAGLDTSRAFFDQQPDDGTVFNIVCVSR